MRSPALRRSQSNQIDVLSRNSTWTMSRESSLGLMFAGVAYYDGQGFLLRREAGIETALQLGGKTVCTQTGTTSELNLTDYFRANEMPLKVLALVTAEESRKAYDDRKCDVLTSDVSQLYAERLKLSAPYSHLICWKPLGRSRSVRRSGKAMTSGSTWSMDALFIDQCRGTRVKSATIDSVIPGSPGRPAVPGPGSARRPGSGSRCCRCGIRPAARWNRCG